MLGKHKEEKKEVAIKFMDVSEQCKHSSSKPMMVYSGIRKHDPGDIQGGRIAQEVESQKHNSTVPCILRGETTMHDNGVCCRRGAAQVRGGER